MKNAAPQSLKPVSFADRREKFFQSIEGGVAIVPAQPEIIRNNDVHYKFRQDSCFYYLTGFNEPDAIAVFRNIGGKKEYILFVRPRDQEKEIWNGYRAGVEGAVSKYQADRSYDVHEFESHTAEIFKGADTLYYSMLKGNDQRVMPMLDEYRRAMGRSGRGLLTVRDVGEMIGEMRIRKDADELHRLRRAGAISAKAHTEVMARCRPGLYEYQLEALMEYVFRNEGSERIGYGSIVAAGSNATVLHYVENNRLLEEGGLLLVDAGAEFDYYTADITRTYAINGRMSAEQKEIYNIVLGVQLACIEMAKPGVTLAAIHAFAVDQLTDAMIGLKFLKGNKQDLIKSAAYKRFYPHGTGHLLGMDVHDSGIAAPHGEPRKLEPGMVFTVEPGFYVQPYDTSVPEKYRGIGVRIEDDVAITATGYEVLTPDVVKTVADMESIIGSKPWLEA